MGQYDTVHISTAKLPIEPNLKQRLESIKWNVGFQTKDLELYNLRFEITDDGELTVEILDQVVTLDKFNKSFRMYTT